MDDETFLGGVADALFGLPTVQAVSLGGSRAQGTHRPDSDWDLAIYYRGPFDPEVLRAQGWEGEVSDLGGWGGGVFNGGAWLHIDGRPVDVHYRDLDVVETEHAKADRGEFHIEPLMFHLAGIPSYLVVGELAINRVLRGSLPSPAFPEALRRSAPGIWAERAESNLSYAARNHAPFGRSVEAVGLVAVAATQYAHAVLASRSEWSTNEKTLLDRAGLRAAGHLVREACEEPDSVVDLIRTMRELGRAAVGEA